MKLLSSFLVLSSLLSPSATLGKGLVYLECQENKGIVEETINIHTMVKGEVKSSHNPSMKQMERNAMRKHKVTLNPDAGTGNWQSDYNPTYYPKHISFSEGDSSDTTILKVSRQKLAEGEVGFARITMMRTTTPFPLKKEWFLKLTAMGNCRVIEAPNDNLF